MRTTGSHADQWRRLLFRPAACGRKAIDGRRDQLSFQIVGRRKRPSQFRNKTQRVACYEMLRNALKRFGMDLARMSYCLGILPSPPPMDPLVIGIPSANRCKNLYNFVNFCIRKQNFAELTPVHPRCALLVIVLKPIFAELAQFA
jgi:hypothetical protein